jgi:hypothetical protein
MTILNERGLREGLRELGEIRKTLAVRERDAERRAGETEAELNALRKLRGFVDTLVEDWQAALRALETEESKDRGTDVQDRGPEGT